MSHSLTLLFKKSDVRDLSKLLAKNELFAQKFVFFVYYIFDSFFPFFDQERIAPAALRSFALF